MSLQHIYIYTHIYVYVCICICICICAYIYIYSVGLPPSWPPKPGWCKSGRFIVRNCSILLVLGFQFCFGPDLKMLDFQSEVYKKSLLWPLSQCVRGFQLKALCSAKMFASNTASTSEPDISYMKAQNRNCGFIDCHRPGQRANANCLRQQRFGL